jgi:hypothetical protein
MIFNTAVPLEITYRDPNGTSGTAYYAASEGKLKLKLPENAPATIITVRELFSGISTTQTNRCDIASPGKKIP